MYNDAKSPRSRTVFGSLSLAVSALVLLSMAPAIVYAATVTINVGPGLIFSPHNANCTAGDTVVFAWQETMAHSATSGDSASCNPDGKFDSGVKSSGSWSWVPGVPGTFPYFCDLHCESGMVGTITVAPHPSSTLTLTTSSTSTTGASTNGATTGATTTGATNAVTTGSADNNTGGNKGSGATTAQIATSTAATTAGAFASAVVVALASVATLL